MPGSPPAGGWDVLTPPKPGDQVKNPVSPTTPINTGCCLSRDAKGNVKTTMPDSDCCNGVSCGGAEKKTQSCQTCTTGADMANTKCAAGEVVYCTAVCPGGHPRQGQIRGVCVCTSGSAKTFVDAEGLPI